MLVNPDGKEPFIVDPNCVLLGICDLCMLPHYFPSVTALFLHIHAKNVHLSPSLLAFYASPILWTYYYVFSLFSDVFAFDFIRSVYNLNLQCAKWLEWNCPCTSNIAAQSVMSGIRAGWTGSPCRNRDFLLHRHFRTGSGTQPACSSDIPAMKRSERDVHQSHSYGVDIENLWSLRYLPQYL